jgi:hypothetical protein
VLAVAVLADELTEPPVPRERAPVGDVALLVHRLLHEVVGVGVAFGVEEERLGVAAAAIHRQGSYPKEASRDPPTV